MEENNNPPFIQQMASMTALVWNNLELRKNKPIGQVTSKPVNSLANIIFICFLFVQVGMKELVLLLQAPTVAAKIINRNS